MPFTLCSPVKPSALCEWETRQIGHMTGSANWRRQRWAVEIGWRTGAEQDGPSANLPKVSRLRRQKGNLANWHGFSGGQQAARRRRRAREMQICTSEIAAVNPPMGGICRGGHRSAKLHNGVLPGGRRKIAHPCADGQRVNPPIGGFVARDGSALSPGRKGANLRNYSISAVFVTGWRPR